ncbi:MAG: helix-turn-helix transcriptional regulator [Actinomycetota bacterium]
MANTSGRMLRLLSLLQTHRYWPGAELAERLEVSPRTLRRDVDRLRALGYPVEATPGVAGGYQLAAGATLPPLLLDDEEAVAIAVALRTSATGAVAGIEETSLRALAKVVQVLPSRLRRRVDALRAFTVGPAPGAGPTVDPAALTTIALACRDGERLGFGYTRRDGETAPRLVEPHRMVMHGRRWYLVAWDTGREDWRSFRVDRMVDPRSAGARFTPRELPGGDAAAFVRAGIAAIPMRHHVEVTFEAPADRVSRFVGPWGTVEALGAGWCRLTMNVDSLDWPAMVLAAVGADFVVVRPPELVEHVRAAAARFARATAVGAIISN